MLAHDSQVAAAGITTVFDAVSVDDRKDFKVTPMQALVEAVSLASTRNVFRAEHFLHMRCEVSCSVMMDLFAPIRDHPLVRLISLMDHTPGQRQFVDLESYQEFYQKRFGYTDAQMRDHMQERLLDQARHGEPQPPCPARGARRSGHRARKPRRRDPGADRRSGARGDHHRRVPDHGSRLRTPRAGTG